MVGGAGEGESGMQAGEFRGSVVLRHGALRCCGVGGQGMRWARVVAWLLQL